MVERLNKVLMRYDARWKYSDQHVFLFLPFSHCVSCPLYFTFLFFMCTILGVCSNFHLLALIDTDKALLSSSQHRHTHTHSITSIILLSSTVNHSTPLDIALHLFLFLSLPLSFCLCPRLLFILIPLIRPDVSSPSTLSFPGLHLLYRSPQTLPSRLHSCK